MPGLIDQFLIDEIIGRVGDTAYIGAVVLPGVFARTVLVYGTSGVVYYCHTHG